MLLLKKDFPIFKNHPKLVYLDNAATSQRPQSVIDSLTDFYEHDNANIHRGVYTLSEEATKKYEHARVRVAHFINAKDDEIIFTKNATEAINLLSYTVQHLFNVGKNEIVVSEMEHHSNLIPWQELCRRTGMKLKFIPVTKNYELDYRAAEKIINEKTALVAVTHVSNVFGTINNIEKITNIAHAKQALTLIDGAQSVAHMPLDVKKIGCDFFVFSSHKMLGPTGVGGLYGKKELLMKLPPFLFGGGMIQNVSYEQATYAQAPDKFEAGTQNIAGVIALATALDYLEKVGMKKIEAYEHELLSYAFKKLQTIDCIILYNPGPEKSSGIISFSMEGVHPHDIAEILNNENIAIRAGHHCCMPLMKKLGISGTARASFSFYNTKDDVDNLVNALKKVVEVFR